MKLDIQKLESVVVRDSEGKELVHIHTIGKKQYLTIYQEKQNEK